jgi:hypothetical protein
MTDTLTIEGPQPYCMTDNEARRIHRSALDRLLAEQAAAARRREAVGIVVSRVRRADVLVELLEAGRLRAEHVRAGHEIAELFRVEVRSLDAKVATYGERLPGGQGGELPPTLRRAYAERFRPWSEEAGRLPANPQHSVRALAIEICAMNRGLRQLADAWCMDQRTVFARLRETLHSYCIRAGWIVVQGAA